METPEQLENLKHTLNTIEGYLVLNSKLPSDHKAILLKDKLVMCVFYISKSMEETIRKISPIEETSQPKNLNDRRVKVSNPQDELISKVNNIKDLFLKEISDVFDKPKDLCCPSGKPQQQ
ncbi:Hypothetical protein ORPV_2 [Orpheovirus IHUMI-LCC2]|uniref:Uncharacterized protein n=1 Tax=Orpheovirus IHUMI-LCC2 TaxID=2023057 RepID=A0A2I2L307_9VIRU|nr:Hypothetical protein ORPV_2 [Orpheovirus IHUMI-LCC2]SNW61906.1 Hypothetical protein ORPV_2 [Orpheovirus IHUMI-LCC2]